MEKKNVSLVVLLLTMTPNPTPELTARNNQGKTVMEIAQGSAGTKSGGVDIDGAGVADLQQRMMLWVLLWIALGMQQWMVVG